MAAAANFAFANRQVMTHWVRRASPPSSGSPDGSASVVYDVCHNIAKFERFTVAGRERVLRPPQVGDPGTADRRTGRPASR